MDYGQDGQACRQTFIYRITEGVARQRFVVGDKDESSFH